MIEKNSSEVSSSSPRLQRMLSTELARCFIVICETGSFKLAAKRLSRSPSAVSLQIAKLEELVECKVLNRSARSLSLTEQGEQLLSYAHRLVAVSDEAIAHFRGTKLSGYLRLAAPHDLEVNFIPRLLLAFAKAYPFIRVDVRLESSITIQEMFAEGSVNVALFNRGNTPQFQATKLYSDKLIWLALRGGKAASQSPLPLAVAEVGCPWREDGIEALTKSERQWRVAYSSDTSMGQIAAVRADLAIAALPRALVDKDIGPAAREFNLPALGRVHLYLAQDGSDQASVFATNAKRWVDQSARR